MKRSCISFLFVAIIFISGCAGSGGWRVVENGERVYYTKAVAVQYSGRNSEFNFPPLTVGDAEFLGMSSFSSNDSTMAGSISSFCFIPETSNSQHCTYPFIAKALDKDQYDRELMLWKEKLGVRNPMTGVPIQEIQLPKE